MSLEAALDVAVDGRVVFAFEVTNVTPQTREVTYRSGLGADVVVYDDGEAVWRHSDGQMFTQGLRTVTLEPGESVRHEATWTDPTPGEYTAEATLAATDAGVSARATFAVQG